MHSLDKCGGTLSLGGSRQTPLRNLGLKCLKQHGRDSPSRYLEQHCRPCRAKLKRGVSDKVHSTMVKAAAIDLPSIEGNYQSRLAIFVSGGGSNFKAIHAAILDGRIKATIAVVISDVPHCDACKYAAQNRIPIVAYPSSTAAAEQNEEHNADSPSALRDLLLHEYNVNYAVLAGYLKLIPGEVVAAFPRAMLNIHPGLLPAFGGKGFYGSRVHKAVIASGARFTGPTVHFVDDDYDTGPILAQRVIPVDPLDGHKLLASKVLKEEHVLYPEAVAALVQERITWRADGIPIMWNAK